MKAIDVSAVEYLNAQPLVHGLKARTDLFTLRFDVPSKCATLLHDKTVDLALIPSIEYLRNDDCRIVPGMAVASTGPVASVALFTDRPATAIRSIAVDASSRTAAALLRVLSAEWFDIEPTFVTLRPDLTTMLKRCDAALLIGDAALYQEHETNGLDKIDLGQEWAAMTGLPFVWAVWAGREDVVSQAHVEALTAARDAGMQSLDAIADQFVSEGDDEETKEIARAYLRENVTYVLDEQCRAGLKKFFAKAADLQLAPAAGTLRFFK
jgi:chorismate dehydratase